MASAPIKHAPDLGKIIECEESRDAVHIAVAPTVAAEKLAPGQDVGIDPQGRATTKAKHIGIVDPFLKSLVFEGQKFFVMLYPNTITSLRHEWTHPAFDGQKADDDKSIAREWVTNFAKQIGHPFDDFDSLMEHVESCINGGEHYVEHGHEHMRDEWYQNEEQFWKHYKTLTGKDKPAEYTPIFCCSC